ncbi:MAG: FtsX-like permease family protein [Gemmatimonadetes bacterium]|nr:FtsX-like permease family protein [Gemmatimonadota bacterium]
MEFDWVIPYVHREIQTGGRGGGKTYLQIADAACVEAAQAFDLDRYMEKEKDRSLVIVPLFERYRPRRPRIIGVVSDFQHDHPSSRGFVPELVLSVRPEYRIATVLVRVRPEEVPETLAELREAWERLAPGVPFSYRFLEDHIAERFLYEAVTISLLRWVTGFLVLIACLGVFGMASLAVSRRTKEVAVRKVLGASTTNVAVLLSSQSTRLVLIAVIVAIPLTYQLSEFLLRSEVDRIELDLLSYSAGGLIALGLTWLVSGYHAIRAALANPVDSLRSE